MSAGGDVLRALAQDRCGAVTSRVHPLEDRAGSGIIVKSIIAEERIDTVGDDEGETEQRSRLGSRTVGWVSRMHRVSIE